LNAKKHRFHLWAHITPTLPLSKEAAPQHGMRQKRGLRRHGSRERMGSRTVGREEGEEIWGRMSHIF